MAAGYRWWNTIRSWAQPIAIPFTTLLIRRPITPCRQTQDEHGHGDQAQRGQQHGPEMPVGNDAGDPEPHYRGDAEDEQDEAGAAGALACALTCRRQSRIRGRRSLREFLRAPGAAALASPWR